MALIETTKGLLDESLLEKRLHTLDNDVELTHAVEYWLDGELVHRSVQMHLKLGQEAPAIANPFA